MHNESQLYSEVKSRSISDLDSTCQTGEMNERIKKDTELISFELWSEYYANHLTTFSKYTIKSRKYFTLVC